VRIPCKVAPVRCQLRNSGQREARLSDRPNPEYFPLGYPKSVLPSAQMADLKDSSPAPQFGTAQYKPQAGADQCMSCNQPITETYFRVNGAMECSSCARHVQSLLPKDSHSAYVRGVVFGVGGAILGLILYAAFGIITGLVIGYVSLAVGYIVGKAILMGSGGIGGRRYQIAAALLTYAAVSMAAIPIDVSQYNKQHANSTGDGPPAQVKSQRGDSTGDAAGVQPSDKSKSGIGTALLMLAGLGLASPFLELQNPIQGFIGLVILFVGIRIAWR
jgi:hypothetical protein